MGLAADVTSEESEGMDGFDSEEETSMCFKKHNFFVKVCLGLVPGPISCQHIVVYTKMSESTLGI